MGTRSFILFDDYPYHADDKADETAEEGTKACAKQSANRSLHPHRAKKKHGGEESQRDANDHACRRAA